MFSEGCVVPLIKALHCKPDKPAGNNGFDSVTEVVRVRDLTFFFFKLKGTRSKTAPRALSIGQREREREGERELEVENFILPGL